MNRAQQTILLLPLLAAAVLSACGTEPIDGEIFTGRVGGCGNFQVYRFNPEMTTAVVVRGTGPELNFDRTPREFALPDPALDVRIDDFADPAHSYYCDDVAGDPDPARTFTAISGTVRIAAGDTLSVSSWETLYKVSVVLKDVTFRDGKGKEVYIRELDLGEVGVGWLPG